MHPVFFGSAITGAGVDALIAGIAELLPAAEGDADGPVSGTVFKVERGPAGEKIAYVRMFSGTVRTRDRLRFGGDDERKVTAISVFERGAAVAARVGRAPGRSASSGASATSRSATRSARRARRRERHHFAPPTLETVVVPATAADKGALHVALAQLAEQDPLINLRQDDVRQEMFVSLYGEVQKEVIQATLATDFGIEVELPRDDDDLHRAADRHRRGRRDHRQGAATRSSPPSGCASSRRRSTPACEFRLEVELGSMPLAFYKAVEDDRASETLQPGPLRLAGHRLHGHHDALRLLAAATGFEHVEHGRLPQPDAAGADERAAAGRHRRCASRSTASTSRSRPTRSDRCCPCWRGCTPSRDRRRCAGSSCMLEGEIPAARVHELQQQLPGADPRRGRAGVRVRPLPAGARRDPDPAAHRTTTRSTARSTCCTSCGGCSPSTPYLMSRGVGLVNCRGAGRRRSTGRPSSARRRSCRRPGSRRRCNRGCRPRRAPPIGLAMSASSCVTFDDVYGAGVGLDASAQLAFSHAEPDRDDRDPGRLRLGGRRAGELARLGVRLVGLTVGHEDDAALGARCVRRSSRYAGAFWIGVPRSVPTLDVSKQLIVFTIWLLVFSVPLAFW